MKKHSLSTLLRKTFAQYANLELTDDFVEMWWEYFDKEDFSVFEAALKSWVMSSESNFLPTIGQIQSEIRTVKKRTLSNNVFNIFPDSENNLSREERIAQVDGIKNNPAYSWLWQ